MKSGLRVMQKRCDQCLFSENKIVDDERAEEVLHTCAKNDKYFTCHKASILGEDVMCRGFYDQNPHATNLMRIADRLDVVRFVSEANILKTRRSRKSAKK